MLTHIAIMSVVAILVVDPSKSNGSAHQRYREVAKTVTSEGVADLYVQTGGGGVKCY